MVFVDIRRTDDVVAFDPKVLVLTLAASETDVIVFRNHDRRAGHWIRPVGKPDDFWFEQKLSRCVDPDNPDVSDRLVIIGTGQQIHLEYTCSLHPDREPEELGVIRIDAP